LTPPVFAAPLNRQHREVFVSSNHRSVPPALLSHPSIAALIEHAAPVGRVAAEDLRQAFAAAEVAPAQLKGLMAHLSGLGISVELGAPVEQRAELALCRPARQAECRRTATRPLTTNLALLGVVIVAGELGSLVVVGTLGGTDRQHG